MYKLKIMKKLTLLFLFVFAIAETYAQNYMITFSGNTNVDSVRIQNNSQCTDTTIGGGSTLNLTASITTGINELNNVQENSLNIYPNPMNGNCFINFNAPAQSSTTIKLYDITGSLIAQSQEVLSKGNHSFSLSGLNSGIYLIKIESENFSYLEKIVNSTATSGKPEIKYLGISSNLESNNTIKNGKSKASKSIIQMLFNNNDTLKLTGKSGNCRTIMMLFPNKSQNVSFTFVKCTDADSNHYAVVQIGTQLWMEENLKATKYRDGSSIQNIPDSASWTNAKSGAYCDYHNLISEGQQYGHIYNFYVASDIRNIAPVGWHVASDSEWTVLTTYIGGVTKAGRKLKEGCNTRWMYLADSCGINACGFTALCANFRSATGAWSLAPNNDHDAGFWTSTTFGASNAWARMLRWCYTDVTVVPPMYDSGYSIRCVHD